MYDWPQSLCKRAVRPNQLLVSDGGALQKARHWSNTGRWQTRQAPQRRDKSRREKRREATQRQSLGTSQQLLTDLGSVGFGWVRLGYLTQRNLAKRRASDCWPREWVWARFPWSFAVMLHFAV
jgi:hypothetical protein